MEEYVVKRDGKQDLSFTGELLADVSSHHHQGPQNLRWTEITIYRTSGGKYVVEIIGRTCWEGEEDRFTGHVCDSPAAVLEALTQENEIEGETFLSWLAKRALEEAAEKDPAFRGLLHERVE